MFTIDSQERKKQFHFNFINFNKRGIAYRGSHTFSIQRSNVWNFTVIYCIYNAEKIFVGCLSICIFVKYEAHLRLFGARLFHLFTSIVLFRWSNGKEKGFRTCR